MIILDIETSGLDPRSHGILSIGAVHFESGREFYEESYLYPYHKCEAKALEVNGFTIERAYDNSRGFKDNVSACRAFIEWCKAVEHKDSDILIAGQQVGSFDVPFIKYIHENTRHDVSKWPFGYRTVDLHSIAYALTRRSMSLDQILEFCGLNPEPKPHNALTGAKLEAEALLIMSIKLGHVC